MDSAFTALQLGVNAKPFQFWHKMYDAAAKGLIWHCYAEISVFLPQYILQLPFISSFVCCLFGVSVVFFCACLILSTVMFWSLIGMVDVTAANNNEI